VPEEVVDEDVVPVRLSWEKAERTVKTRRTARKGRAQEMPARS
jgi:hypothetical protein